MRAALLRSKLSAGLDTLVAPCTITLMLRVAVFARSLVQAAVTVAVPGPAAVSVMPLIVTTELSGADNVAAWEPAVSQVAVHVVSGSAPVEGMVSVDVPPPIVTRRPVFTDIHTVIMIGPERGVVSFWRIRL